MFLLKVCRDFFYTREVGFIGTNGLLLRLDAKETLLKPSF